MRRFISFIVLAISILAISVFNIQSTGDKINWSMEFDEGREITYRIETRDDSTEIDMDDFVEKLGIRLEDAGATSYEIESAVDEGNKYEVKIAVGARYVAYIDNILRSAMSAGPITLFTTDDNGAEINEESIVRHSADIYFDANSQAYVKVEVTDAVKEINDSFEDDNASNRLLVLWQGKYEDLKYKDLAEEDYSFKEKTNEQLKDKVLAVINLDANDPTTAEDGTTTIDNSRFIKEEVDGVEKYYITFDSYGYANDTESTTKFTAQSARSFVRMFNSDLLDYEITELNSRTIKASYGSTAADLMVWSNVIAIVIVCAFLLINYGFTAISGCAGISVATLIAVALFNFFSIQVGPISILALVCSLTMSTSMLCVYYRRTKENAYDGRSLSKSSNDGYRKAISTAVDSTVLLFALGIILSVVSGEKLKSFGLFLLISSLVNVLFTFILSKCLNNYLMNSVATEKPSLFALKLESIADLNGNREKDIPVDLMQRISVKKHSKKAFVGSVLGMVVALGSIIGFGIANDSFNYSNSNEYGRIEIRTVYKELFDERNYDNDLKTNVIEYFKEFDSSLNVINEPYSIETENPNDKDKNYVYFYVDFDSPVSADNSAYIALEEMVAEKDDQHSEIATYVVNSGTVKSDFNNSLILIGITLGVTLVYFLVRYHYAFALSSTTSLIVGSTISLGLLSLLRLEVSAFVGVGLLAGVVVTMLLFIPIGNRINQLKNESKVKITTYDQREVISYQAMKDSISIYVKSFVGYSVILLALIPLVPNMLTIYLSAVISLLVNGLVGMFVLIPFTLFIERNVKFSKARAKRMEIRKAKREKLAKANRNRGAEPEEIIIPGIND